MAAKGQKLTPRQEAFARKFVETGNATSAYREAFGSKGKDTTVATDASRTLKLPIVAAYVAELRAAVRTDHDVTLASLLTELEEARQMGNKTGNASAMVAATMAKAKLSGLDKGEGDDDQVATPVKVEVTVTDARKPAANADA